LPGGCQQKKASREVEGNKQHHLTKSGYAAWPPRYTKCMHTPFDLQLAFEYLTHTRDLHTIIPADCILHLQAACDHRQTMQRKEMQKAPPIPTTTPRLYRSGRPQW
jgi:hypothetical protein